MAPADVIIAGSDTPLYVYMCVLKRVVLLSSGLLELNVSGCPWSSVSALCQSVCPCLRLLDLSRVEDLKDSHLKELLAPPSNDTRSGLSLSFYKVY